MYDTPLHGGGRSAHTDDELADILADPHCRLLLEYLRETENPATVSAITTHVVSEITGTAPDSVPQDVVRRVQTWLHHGQLPTLDAHGVVDFDPESGVVDLQQHSVG